MLRRQLPPLNSLRAFEAAGRHLSITMAAAELAVTQAAVSHQVKALESHLGTALFVRSGRKLELTDAGAMLLPIAVTALDSLNEAAARIRSEKLLRPVELGVPPMFASCWLLPRLDQLLDEHPDLEVALRHIDGPANLDSSSLDIAVIYGGNDWSGLLSVPLLGIDYFPVCAPSLLEICEFQGSPADLAELPLLHDKDYLIWESWFELAGVLDADITHGVVVEDTSVLIQAAMDGLGVAMCSGIFVNACLADGRLVRPVDLTLEIDKAYHAVCTREALAAPQVKCVWDWLAASADDRVPILNSLQAESAA